MIKISEQEFIKRYDVLPEAVRQAILSEDSVDMLWTIGGAHHLSEDRIGKVAGVIGYIILGLVHLEDLAKEIVIEAGVDRRLAEEIAREIKLKILNPIIPQLQQLYHYGPAGVVAPSTPTTPALSPSEPQQIRPSFAEPPANIRDRTPDISPNTPFILHEEQKEIESVRPMEESLVRPSFYEGADMRHETQDISERPSAARLEIGGVEEVRKEGPEVGKTEESPVRVVHYSGPQTPVDPFGSQTPDISNQSLEAKEQKSEPPKDIHPENVVDLKDLPK